MSDLTPMRSILTSDGKGRKRKATALLEWLRKKSVAEVIEELEQMEKNEV